MKSVVRLLSFVVILSLTFGMSGCLNRMDVSGTWVGFVIWDPGDGYAGETTTIQLELLQDRRAITGAIVMDASFMALNMDIVSGDGSNNYMTLESAGTAQGTGTTYAIFLNIEGMVNDKRIEGTGTMTINGVSHTFTWQAQRSS